MVWVDTPMNQAKSNVVNQNKNTPDNPPQKDNINLITDFTNSKDLIDNIEYFVRNIAALGQYFDVNSAVFRDTAQRVQNLLAEVTPTTPINPSLPTTFNKWLRNLISTYPNGCMSRATNTFNYYRNQMSTVSANLGGTTVPSCYSMFYTLSYNPSSFVWQPLIPAAPTLPLCDGPGTKGRMSVGSSSSGPNFIVPDPSTPNPTIYTVMGSGNTAFFALGSGLSLGTSHWFAIPITGFNTCNSVYDVRDVSPDARLLDLNVALDCGAQTGSGMTAPFNFVLNGQQLVCTLMNFNDGSGKFNILCGSSQTAAEDCANEVIKSGSTNFPKADLSTPTFLFYGD